jgi:myo-inositol-1(or 4)-monophosphatase
MCNISFKETAVKAAKEAASIHRKYFRKDFKINKKQSSFDLVTTADIEAENKIVKVIKESFPGHNILGEEEEYKKTDSEFCWIIDPLDGTNNFAFGLPIFSVSIALVKSGCLVLGVVYDTIREELFLAQRGKGAFLNNERIEVSRAENLQEALLITGFYYDRGLDMENNLDKIKEFFKNNIVGIRRLGSAALDLCYIACGRASGFWEFKLSPWDFAAGILIVQEAGGKVTDKYGNAVELKESFIAASNGNIHQEILRVIR